MNQELYTLTGLRDYLNKTYQKASGKPFSLSNVQGYVLRKRLPKYLGEIFIKRVKNNVIGGAPMYKVVVEGSKNDVTDAVQE
jgi:hypothetical protein